mgnify:CR=1 FL=1
MAHVQVYHSRSNYAAADAFVAALREAAEHSPIGQGRSDRWDGELVGEIVYHDGSSRALVAAYEAAGVPCHLFGESLTNVEVDAPEIVIDEPAALPDGYVIEQHGSWRHVLGPDGEIVGKSQNDAAAVALAVEHATGV